MGDAAVIDHKQKTLIYSTQLLRSSSVSVFERRLLDTALCCHGRALLHGEYARLYRTDRSSLMASNGARRWQQLFQELILIAGTVRADPVQLAVNDCYLLTYLFFTIVSLNIFCSSVPAIQARI